ncbi:hypothetical protein LVJ82_08460 [Vitreoscilla massiliensis]|uniref:Uncharacterized protein n=1 Tax=Vitreoscilla massiliensis TaxID=1689272 RepID=A0ABY4E6H3_9NEIS|nr:hypothetical protein [Vitreoscilla massiliensis]UOO90980.1 hypothetical protein LVJ82_08460 [Vitreoscilla massiliensis]
MLKQLSLGLMVLASTGAVMAAGITAEDAGIYEVVKINKDNKPASLSGIQMRIYQKNGDWLMDGKDDNIKSGPAKGKWFAVCNQGTKCEFKTSSKSQLKDIFPDLARIQKTDDIGCIQNDVQAICRLDSKVQKGYTAYMTVVLQSKPHVYMTLQRRPS